LPYPTSELSQWHTLPSYSDFNNYLLATTSVAQDIILHSVKTKS